MPRLTQAVLLPLALIGAFALGALTYHLISGRETEDIGTRLRRECESIVEQSKTVVGPVAIEYAIRSCIERRGTNAR